MTMSKSEYTVERTGTTEHSSAPATLWQHFRQWWHEPHFIGKTALVMLTLLAVGNVTAMANGSDSAIGVQVCYLIAYAALAIWHRWPRIMGPVLLAAMPIVCSYTLVYALADLWPLYVAALLGIGYLMPRWFAAVAPIIGMGFETGSVALLYGGSFRPAMFGALNPLVDVIEGVTGAMFAQDSAGATQSSRQSSPQAADWSLMPVSPIVACLLAVTSTLLMYAFVAYGAYARNRDRLRADAREQRLIRERLARTRHNQRLAGMIHDSVTNDLSQVVMLAYQARTQFDADANPRLAVTMDAIDQRTHAALAGIHEVIDLLLDGEPNGSGSPTGDEAKDMHGAVGGRDESSSDPIASLKRMADAEETKLHELGYRGVTRWEGDAIAADPTRLALVEGLLKEIYANVLRHCTSGDDAYHVFVTLDDATVRITEVNPVREAPEAMRGLSSGRGLGLHRKAVEDAGGEFNAGVQDGTWTLDAMVPLR
ncbi:hypothetical protein [Bifidobacterium simiarum]|uniref:Signal transduction histidine kinase subgroup 3 dimerisation and phosphoacceptor domain-containing protein n=1 Tax=Bifidobacterium simiarum TaxID=2045441 RepID=A0A2M9HD19_9BIFI|nr:hypothetical protein [Bifidobacterium simiarum]PJM74715.1 hypothetical protein CSQ87_08260 [Bifidobacterium simiarum]